MSRLGISFSGGADPAEIVECVKLAETLGYESAWVAEGHGGDQFAVLSACAVQTSKILLGTSITSVFVRTVPTIAMAAMTVDAISGGRFILGIGSSHKVQVELEHGVPYRKPLTRVRESVEAIRALLRDGRVHYTGETVGIESFDSVVHAAPPGDPNLSLRCSRENDRTLRRDRRWRGPDAQHASHCRARQGMARRGRRASRPRSEPDRCRLAVADRSRRNSRRGARCIAAGSRLLCRLFPPLQPDDG